MRWQIGTIWNVLFVLLMAGPLDNGWAEEHDEPLLFQLRLSQERIKLMPPGPPPPPMSGIDASPIEPVVVSLVVQNLGPGPRILSREFNEYYPFRIYKIGVSRGFPSSRQLVGAGSLTPTDAGTGPPQGQTMFIVGGFSEQVIAVSLLPDMLDPLSLNGPSVITAPGLYLLSFSAPSSLSGSLGTGDVQTEVLFVVEERSPAYRISTAKKRVKVGNPVKITWKLDASVVLNRRDWIGMYRVGDTNRQFLPRLWAYTNGTPEGLITFSAPSTPGAYEVRYLLNNGYQDVARKVFVVE